MADWSFPSKGHHSMTVMLGLGFAEDIFFERFTA
jgi:hypothetical protein